MNIETGSTVRNLVDGQTSDKFPVGTIGRIEQKVAMHDKKPLDFLYWVVRNEKRSDGVDVVYREPFYADELELLPCQQ